MAKTKTAIRLDLAPDKVRGFKFDDDKYRNYQINTNDLQTLGIAMDADIMDELSKVCTNPAKYAMDGVPLQTTATITNPVQFFQYWAPEAVEIVTAARKIDDIVGRTMAGSFEDEEIVTRIMERTGRAQPYTDTTNIPFASWNQNYDSRNIVRFEEGLQVGYLEQMRASRMRVDDHREKAAAVAQSLAIEHNNVGFFGYANGQNRTFGLLNDPNLPAYQTVAQGASGSTSWSRKTFNEITADIITAVSTLVNQLAGWFDPTKDSFTLTMSLASTQWLNTMNELGTKSVYTWLRETYPNIRIESAVELNEANGGSNVFYLNVDRYNNVDVMKQYVQDVMRLIGVEKKAKVFIEDYASATAGVIVQQPLGMVRYSGI